MRELFARVGGLIVGLAFIVFWLVVITFYLSAFLEGAQMWFGLRDWLNAVLFFVVIFLLGPFGQAFCLIGGAYGAFYGWHWPWYYVVPAFFPGFIFMFIGVTMGGVSALIGKVRHR